MFDLFCPHCSTRRLIFAGQVRDLVNDQDGVHVLVECWCGGLVRWNAQDRAVPAQASAPTAERDAQGATRETELVAAG